MKRKMAVLAVSFGALAGFSVAVTGAAHATTVPAVCVHQPTAFGQIEVGYCPNG